MQPWVVGVPPAGMAKACIFKPRDLYSAWLQREISELPSGCGGNYSRFQRQLNSVDEHKTLHYLQSIILVGGWQDVKI